MAASLAVRVSWSLDSEVRGTVVFDGHFHPVLVPLETAAVVVPLGVAGASSFGSIRGAWQEWYPIYVGELDVPSVRKGRQQVLEQALLCVPIAPYSVAHQRLRGACGLGIR